MGHQKASNYIVNTERLSAPAVTGRWNTRPLVILAAVVVVMYLAREVLIPLAFALVLSLIWTPPVNWLQRLHIGRAPAVLVVVALSLGVAGDVAWIIANQLITVVNELPKYQQNIHEKITRLRSSGRGSLGQAAESVERLGKELSTAPATGTASAARIENDRGHATTRSQSVGPIPVQVVEGPANTFDYLSDLARRFVRPLGITGIVLIFSVFLLIERQDVRNRLLRLVGLGQLNLMTQALDDAGQRVSRYLLLQFAVNAGFGLVIGIGLYFIGLPYAALWGTVAAALRIVPYVGTMIAGTLPLLLSIAVFNTWRAPILVLALIVSLELVIGNWVEPRLYGAHTGVSSLAILVTTVFWTILWGPAGLILSMPLTVCVAVLGRYVPQFSFLHILLGDEPVLTVETQVYQRLLAMDREEARDVADIFLKEQSLLELYDRVFVPALTMAEQHRHKGALDETRERYIFLSVKEMIVEYWNYAPEAASPSTAVSEAESVPLEMPKLAFEGRVFCIPAIDEADEITASMLAQLLERHGIPAIAFPIGETIDSMFTHLEPQPQDVICLSALPPFAFAQARTSARRLKVKFPEARVVVGVWGFAGDVQLALDRFEQPRPDRILISLADAIDYFNGTSRPAKVAS
jgi:predicted PurR-regulated permease PerM